jgi:uncharacterized protein YicC (UPF0701 family)
VDVTLAVERRGGSGYEFNRELVGGYVEAFRKAAQEFGTTGEPDLNNVFRMPGALGVVTPLDGNFQTSVLDALEQAIQKLNIMREQEGQGMEAELRRRLAALEQATGQVDKLRAAVSKAYMEKVRLRMQELIENTHIDHFRKLLDQGGEVGKKLDFLLQELNREANTLLSKTSGVSGEGLRITELGLLMKSEIEKCREQVQNLE